MIKEESKTFCLYKVSLKKGISCFDVIEKKYGWVTLADGTRVTESGFYASEESAQKQLEKLKKTSIQKGVLPDGRRFYGFTFTELEQSVWKAYCNNLSCPEIAQILGVTTLSVQSRLNKSVRKLNRVREMAGLPQLNRTELRKQNAKILNERKCIFGQKEYDVKLLQKNITGVKESISA